jgi:competence protein ComEC
VCVVSGAIVSVIPSPRLPPDGSVWLIVLDVGQGDAVAIAHSRGWWLVDAGPRAPGHDAGERIVVPFFRWAGVRRLETLVITHLDRDHAGGARAVWTALDPEQVRCPDPAIRTMAPPGAVALPLARGDTLHRAPRLHARWPPAGAPVPNRNAGSAVLALENGATRVLLTGDIDAAVEAHVVWPESTAVLKVAHHGARGSTSRTFLARARPGVAVISSGRRNPFGHPHPESLARLDSSGVRVLRTDLEGAVWFALDPRGARRLDWRDAPVSGRARAGIAAPPPARVR